MDSNGCFDCYRNQLECGRGISLPTRCFLASVEGDHSDRIGMSTKKVLTCKTPIPEFGARIWSAISIDV